MHKENSEKMAKEAREARLKIEEQNKKILEWKQSKGIEARVKNMLLPQINVFFKVYMQHQFPKSYCVEPQPISTWKMESTFSSFPWQHQV